MARENTAQLATAMQNEFIETFRGYPVLRHPIGGRPPLALAVEHTLPISEVVIPGEFRLAALATRVDAKLSLGVLGERVERLLQPASSALFDHSLKC